MKGNLKLHIPHEYGIEVECKRKRGIQIWDTYLSGRTSRIFPYVRSFALVSLEIKCTFVGVKPKREVRFHCHIRVVNISRVGSFGHVHCSISICTVPGQIL